MKRQARPLLWRALSGQRIPRRNQTDQRNVSRYSSCPRVALFGSSGLSGLGLGTSFRSKRRAPARCSAVYFPFRCRLLAFNRIIRANSFAGEGFLRILLVEDQSDAAQVLAKGLREHSYAVDIAGDGEVALYQTSINDYDLILLDVMLPRQNGIEVCKTLHAGGSAVPILMLTARDAVPDRVRGLDAGADDYLTKPFDFHELLARIRALLRRGPELQAETLQVADLVIDKRTRRAWRSNRVIELTAKEYALLDYLARHVRRGRGSG